MSPLHGVTVTHYRAVRILQETGNTFTLTVAKRAADFYGISYNIPSTRVSSLDRHGDHHGDHQGKPTDCIIGVLFHIVPTAAKSSFALKAERRRRREEQMKQHQGNSNSGGRKDSGMVLSIQKVSSLDESTASSCQSPVTNSNPQLTRWIMEQKRLQAERLSSHSSSRPTKLDATSDRESPMCYHDDSDNSSLCNSYTSGSRSYREGTKPQPDRDTPPELLRHDSNGLHGSWKRHKSIDESNHDDTNSHHTPKYQQEPSQDFPDHYNNQVNLSMDVQPSQLTNNSLPSSAAVLESSLFTSRQQRVGSGKMKQIMEHEPTSPIMVDDEPLKKEEYHHHGNKDAGLHLEAKLARDTMPVEINNMKLADVQQMAVLIQQHQQPGKPTGSQSDSDTVIDGDGSQEDARKHKLHQLIIELEERKRELERLEQDKANEEHKLAIEEQRYTEQEIKDEQMALRMGQPMSVEISRKRRRRELQKKRDEASERIQLLEFDKHRVRTKMLVLEKNVEELRAIIEQDQKMGSHDQKMGSHERSGSLDQRMLFERTGSHDHSRIEYQRMGSHDARMMGGSYERTGSRMEYQRMGSHDGRIGPYERTGSYDQKRGRSRPPSAQAHNKEVSHDLPPASPRFHHAPSAFVSASPKLRTSPVMVPMATEPYMMPRHVPVTTRASPIIQQQNFGRASVRGTMGSPYKEMDNNLSRKKSRSRDLEEITSLSNKSVSETPSPYPVSMVTRDNVEDRHGKGHDQSSSTVTRKDSARGNKPKSLFMSTTTLNDQPHQSQRSNPPNKTKPTSYRNSRPHNNTVVDANSLANLERTMKSPVSNSTTPTTPTLLRQHLTESTNGGNSGRHCYSKSTGGESNPHSYSRMEQDPTCQQHSDLAREAPLILQQWPSHAKSHHHGNAMSRNITSLNPHHRNHDYQPEEEGSSDETSPHRDIGESPAAPDVIQSTFTSSCMSSCSPDGVGTSASPSPELPADNLYSPVVPPITSLTLSCSQQYSPPHSPPAAFHRHLSPLAKPVNHPLPWEYKQARALSPQQRTTWEHQTHPTKLVAKDTTHPGRLPLPSNRRTPVHLYPGTDL